MTNPSPSQPAATWVAKLGGSLLEPPDLPQLPARLLSLVRQRGGERPLLVNGGGELVESIRRWDRLFGLGESFCHGAAVRALDLKARILERLLPGTRFVDSEAELRRSWREGLVPVLSLLYFVEEVDAARGDALPRIWDVTSDSIAARVAEHYGACELALLKSTSAAEDLSTRDAAARGLVDPCFADLAASLPRVVVANLRADPVEVTTLRTGV